MAAEESTYRIETLVIVRPLKAVALVLAALALLLMSLSLAATSWLEANSTLEGLWEKCHYLVNDPDRVNCDLMQSRGWLHACRGLCITAMVLCLTGIIFTSVGLRSVNAQRRPRWYMAAMVIWFVSVGIELTSLLAFPIKFLEEILEEAELHWHFGWGYWVGWASAIFIFVSGLLLVIDKNAEEIVYREVTNKKKQLGSDEETDAV